MINNTNEMPPAVSERQSRFVAWRMVALACMSVNLAVGTVFGLFAVVLIYVSEDFNVGAAAVASTISVIIFLNGICGPLVGKCLDRYSIQRIMQLGVILMGAGFWIAAHSTSLLVFQLGFGVFIGLGSSMMAHMPSVKLVSNWFIAQRGRAIGIVNLPLLGTVMPVAAAALIELYGWRNTLAGIGTLVLSAIIPMQWIINRPSDIGTYAMGETRADDADQEHVQQETNESQELIPILGFLRNRQFWMVNIAFGMAVCSGITLGAHVVNHAKTIDLTTQQGALLLTIMGLSGIFGTVFFGMLADKIGERLTLIVNFVLSAMLWLGLTTVTQFAPLLVTVLVISFCSSGFYPPFASLIARMFGPKNLGTALGSSTMLQLPFITAAAPVAGWLFDAYNSYTSAFILHAVLLLFAIFIFSFLKVKQTATDTEAEKAC